MNDAINGAPPEAKQLTTAEISDTLDAMRLPGSVLGIGHVAGGKQVFGPAFTVQYVPVQTVSPGTVGDYLDDTPAGAVVVIDNAGRTDCTVWGGILSRLANKRNMPARSATASAATRSKRTGSAAPFTLGAASCGAARIACRCRRLACRSASATSGRAGRYRRRRSGWGGGRPSGARGGSVRARPQAPRSRAMDRESDRLGRHPDRSAPSCPLPHASARPRLTPGGATTQVRPTEWSDR